MGKINTQIQVKLKYVSICWLFIACNVYRFLGFSLMSMCNEIQRTLVYVMIFIARAHIPSKLTSPSVVYHVHPLQGKVEL